jgi:hypothetical protein
MCTNKDEPNLNGITWADNVLHFIKLKFPLAEKYSVTLGIPEEYRVDERRISDRWQICLQIASEPSQIRVCSAEQLLGESAGDAGRARMVAQGIYIDVLVSN